MDLTNGSFPPVWLLLDSLLRLFVPVKGISTMPTIYSKFRPATKHRCIPLCWIAALRLCVWKLNCSATTAHAHHYRLMGIVMYVSALIAIPLTSFVIFSKNP